MRILIISTYFPPLNSIGSLRAYSWAKYWSLQGHEVTVLTTQKVHDETVALNLPNPGYKIIEVPMPGFFNKMKKASLNSQKEHSPKKWPTIKKLLITFFRYLQEKRGIFHQCRMPDFTDLWVKPAFNAIRDKGKWDLVVSSAWPYNTHRIALKLKRAGLTKIWCADYRDLWTVNCQHSGIFPFTIYERILENIIVKNADIVTTVSQGLADHFQQQFHKNNVFVVENGFDPDDLQAVTTLPSFFNDGKYRIVHTGSVYHHKQDPSPLFKAIHEMALDSNTASFLNNLEILFVGRKDPNLESLINSFQVDRWVRHIGFVSREDALRMQQDAHALLFLPWIDQSINGVLTGKIFEYLFSGTPILCIGAKNLEASQRLVQEAKAGTILHSTAAIKKLLIDNLNNIQKKKSTPSQQFLELYTRENLAKKMLGKAFPEHLPQSTEKKQDSK